MTEAQDGERISKTRRKREMHALQALGEQLAALPIERLARMDMPDELREALVDAQRMTRHEARRRQLQYVGRLMREVDVAPIRAALDAVNGASATENARLHRLERLRMRLLEDEQVLAEIAAAYPGADLQQLHTLRRNALREQASGKPPKSFRELFRVLRHLENQVVNAEHAESAGEARE